MIVADTGNDRVQLFTTAGVFAIGFGAVRDRRRSFEAPNAVATDCRSNLFVLDAGNCRVQKFGASASAVWPAGRRVRVPARIDSPSGGRASRRR